MSAAASDDKRAAVIGIGMIGGSVAAALRRRGWFVTGDDVDATRVEQAIAREVVDAGGIDPHARITFIATPVSDVATQARAALERGSLVTDVGSVKGTIAQTVVHENFVGGHPMAGSERAGLDGVNPDLFEGATWVLTPSSRTSPEVYLEIRNLVASLGADIVTLDPDEHDEMVATISHVPHLAASALMDVALRRSSDHDAILRLAAGGFRDMTRIAAGHPSLWADIALDNRAAIIEGIGELTAALDQISESLASSNRAELEAFLASAAQARKDLPLRQGRPSVLSSLAVVIPDTPGALGHVFSLMGELKVNVEDVDINHAIGGGQGTLLLTVAASGAARAREGLTELGFVVTEEQL